MTNISGRAWTFGDGINTDVMAPGLYFKSSLEIMATHCMEAVDPGFWRSSTSVSVRSWPSPTAGSSTVTR